MQQHLMNTLITWRLTELLVDERGPYAVFDKLREYAIDASPNNRFWQELTLGLQCRFCTSVWVGVAVAIATQQSVLYGLGYSAGALLFGRIFERLDG